MNKSRCFLCAAAVVLAGMLQGCDVLRLVGTIEVPATIVFNGRAVDITAPDTITRGTPFQISFQSSENGCTEAHGRDEVAVTPDSILIRPFVTTQRTCGNDALRIMPHLVNVTLNQAGVVRIYVVGRQQAGSMIADTVLTDAIVVR